jgi:hypothetical protein
LIGVLGALRPRDINLYLHQRAIDNSTPSGRMLLGMLVLFSSPFLAMENQRQDICAGAAPKMGNAVQHAA